jgi:hypothetical protein
MVSHYSLGCFKLFFRGIWKKSNILYDCNWFWRSLVLIQAVFESDLKFFP